MSEDKKVSTDNKMSKEKKMGLVSLVGTLVAGIVVLDTFAAPAAMGYGALGLWLIVAIFFMIPNGFINAELGSKDPTGLVSWIKKTVGEKHATVMGFFYWVNVSLWMPAVFIVFTFWIDGVFFDYSLHWSLAMLIGVSVNWIVVLVVRRGTEFGSIMNNISASIKILTLLLIGILGIVAVQKNGISGTGLSVGKFFPSFDSIDSIGLVSAIVFNLLGFELISAMGDSVKNAKKNIPLAIVIGAVVIGGLYIFGTFGVLAGSSVAEISDDTYLADALPLSLQNLVVTVAGGPEWLYKILMAGVLFSLATSMISWISGASEILEDLDFAADYKVFSDRHPKYDTLSKSFILMGIISTIFIIMGFSMEYWGDGGAFWTILALSMVVFIIPYLYLTPAIIIFRKKNIGSKDSYQIPGGPIVMWMVAILNFFFVGLAIVMLFVQPVGSPALYYSIVVIGTLGCSGIGYYLYWDKSRKSLEKTK